MTLTSKERAALRKQSHGLPATVHIGKQGLTPPVLQSLDDALRTHEIVKIQLGKSADFDAKEAARELAEAVGADIVQVIGKTVTLFREAEEEDR